MDRAPQAGVKRRNVQEAFVGEPTGASTASLDNYAEGDEAVDIEVRGGQSASIFFVGRHCVGEDTRR